MKNRTLTLLVLLHLAAISKSFSQNVAINATGSLPDASALLDVSSNTKGFLVPRMSTTQQNAITLPATGLIIFNTTVNLLQVNTGTPASPVWSSVNTPGAIDTSNIANFYKKVRSELSGGTGISYNNSTGLISNSGVTSLNGSTGNIVIPTGDLTETGSSVLTITGGTGAVIGTGTALQVRQATTSTSGYLSSTDWNTFNNKPDANNTWTLTGNSGSNPSTNFIGTTDNQSLVFKTNNQQSGKIDLPLNNSLFGYQAGKGITTGSNITYTGYQSGYNNTSGSSNTGTGSISLFANTTGSNNTAFGFGALGSNTTGSGNTATGAGALRNSTNTASNSAFGNSSLNLTTTGSGNTAIGNSSGATNTTGSNNTFIGNSADATSSGISNATAIGYNAKATASNTMILGTAGVNVGVGTNTFNGTNPEKLVVDAGTTTSVNAIVGKGSIDSYLQLNIQNNSAGASASSDVVATANNGSETTNYVDMGINGGGNTANVMGTADDAYLYNNGQNFLIGAGTTGKSLLFLTGGTDSASNERMRIDGSGNVGIGVANPAYKLQISAASNPLYLGGVQNGTGGDSLVTISNGVIRKVPATFTPSSNAWGLAGNASTNPSFNFIGTTDAQAFLIKENSTQVARFDANSMALGNGATTNNAPNAYAFGSGAYVGFNKTAAMALGNNSAINADSSFAIGTAAIVNGANSFAIGSGATSNNTNSFAIGRSAITAYSITDAVAIGTNATANASNSIAIGSNTTLASKTVTNAASAIALGNAAISSSANAIAIGTGATTGYNQTNPIAIGYGVTVNGNSGTAVGNGASISNISNATAIGAGASASGTATNSTAIGYNTAVTKINEVILGDMTNTALSVGIGSENFSSSNREKLLVDAGTTTSVNAIVGKGSIDSYLQLNIQNNSAGTSASSDVVATANNGTETNNFVDMGINGGNYSGGVMGNANDAYLYNLGQNFLIGAGSVSKSLAFMTGGTSQSANERMRIDGTGNVGINTTTPGNKLEVNSGTGGASGLRLKQLPAGGVLFMSSSADVTQNNSNFYFDATNYRLSVGAGTSPNSTLQLGGSMSTAITTKTANYTASTSDYTIVCNNTSGAITIALPAATGATGRIYVVKKISVASNNVTIDPSGSETIDGALTRILSTQYESVMIQCDGTSWYILANN